MVPGRTAAITCSAVLLSIASVLALLAGAVVMPLNRMSAAIPLAAGVWGLVTSTGILRRQRWARISMLWLAGFAVIAGAATCLGLSHAAPDMQAPPRAAVFVLIAVALVVIACGCWWLVLFNSRSAHWHFQSHPARPLRVSLVVSYLVLDAFYNAGNLLLVGNRAQLFAWKYNGTAAQAVYVAVIGLEIACAASAWLWRERARRFAGAFLAVYSVHAVMALLTHLSRPRWDLLVLDAAGTVLTVTAMLLTVGCWTKKAGDEGQDRPVLGDDLGYSPAAGGVLTTGELVRFAYFQVNRRLWPVSLLAVILVLLIPGVMLLSPGLLDSPIVKNVMPLAALLLFWLPMPWWMAWSQQRKLQYLREHVTYHLDTKGFRVEGKNFRTEIGWKLVHAVRETKTLFLLYQSPETAWVIPKRFLASETDVEAFRSQIERGLGDSPRYHAPGVIGSFC